MKQVNIYIESTITFGRAQRGVTGYILEYTSNGKSATLSAGIAFGSATKYEAEIVTLTMALSRIIETCYITVYTEDAYFRSLLNGWLAEWRAAGWKKRDGQQVKHSDILAILALMIGDQEIIAVGDHHQYRNWLKSEIAKAAFSDIAEGCVPVAIPCK